MAERSQWHVIGRGFAGWHAKGIRVSSSGGDIVDRPWWAGGVQRGYLSDAVDGALIYDAEQADRDAFSRFVISGPMVDPALDPAEVNAFTDVETAGRMLPNLDGGLKTIATLAQLPTYRGLDCVGVGLYRELLKQIPGIKLGTVRNGAIVWEDDTAATV